MNGSLLLIGIGFICASLLTNDKRPGMVADSTNAKGVPTNENQSLASNIDSFGGRVDGGSGGPNAQTSNDSVTTEDTENVQ